MTDRLELTKREREAAAEAAYIAHEMAIRGDGKAAPWGQQIWSQDNWRQSIDAALAAINRVRCGDPVGTIRRSTDWAIHEGKRGSAGAVATMTEKGWCIQHETGDCTMLRAKDSLLKTVASWPVIYSPDGDS